MKRFYFILFCVSVAATVLSNGIVLFMNYSTTETAVFAWIMFTVSLIGAKQFWLENLQKEPEELSTGRFAGTIMLLVADLVWTTLSSQHACELLWK